MSQVKPPSVPVRTASDVMNARAKLGDKFSPEAIRKQEEEASKEVARASQPMTSQQNDLERLIFLGRVERTLSVSGFSFKMSTLTTNQQKFVITEVSRVKEDERIFYLKNSTIALSISEINGIDFDVFINNHDKDFYARLEFINNLQSNLVDSLFKFYTDVFQESVGLLNMEEIKK
jgi:hypothetical protein